MLPIRPYNMTRHVLTHECAMQGVNDVELFGTQATMLKGEVIACLMEDNGEAWIDRSGPEPRFLVSLAPAKHPRSFVLMTESEVRDTFVPTSD